MFSLLNHIIRNGLKEGRGLFEWPEKSKYNGEFHLNELEG
jgi:hypothetical protein